MITDRFFDCCIFESRASQLMTKANEASNTRDRFSLIRPCERVDTTPRAFIPNGFKYFSRRQLSQSTSGNEDTFDGFLNDSAENVCSKFRASENPNDVLVNSEAIFSWHNDHQSALNFWEQTTVHSGYIPASKNKQQRVEPKHG